MSDVQMDLNEIKEGAPFAALSYVFCFWILAFILKKDNQFAYFHAKQGIVLFVGEIACTIFAFIPVLGGLFGFLLLVLMCFALYGIYLSLTGKMASMPIIGDIAQKLVV
jgi:uncharacterized membrane protein